MTAVLPPEPFSTHDWLEHLSTPAATSSAPETLRVGEAAALTAAAAQLGWHVAHIDVHDNPDKTSLLQRCATAMRLPDYFGHNWDALADALNDLDWLDCAGMALLLRTDGNSLPSSQTLQTLLDIVQEAAQLQAERDWPLRIFFVHG